MNNPPIFFILYLLVTWVWQGFYLSEFMPAVCIIIIMGTAFTIKISLGVNQSAVELQYFFNVL
jgi:hypothetical protein